MLQLTPNPIFDGMLRLMWQLWLSNPRENTLRVLISGEPQGKPAVEPEAMTT